MIQVLEPSDLKVGDYLIGENMYMVEVIALGTRHVIAKESGFLMDKEIVLTQNDLVDYEVRT